MTGLASVFTMNNLQKSDNVKLIVLGLITSVLTFYFKDLSLALGQTDRIPLILAVWAPVDRPVVALATRRNTPRNCI